MCKSSILIFVLHFYFWSNLYTFLIFNTKSSLYIMFVIMLAPVLHHLSWVLDLAVSATDMPQFKGAATESASAQQICLLKSAQKHNREIIQLKRPE